MTFLETGIDADVVDSADVDAFLSSMDDSAADATDAKGRRNHNLPDESKLTNPRLPAELHKQVANTSGEDLMS